VERGEAMLGHDAPNSETFVIGDTPLDVQAAHAVDCTAIAVATGKSPTHVRSPPSADRAKSRRNRAPPVR
jgi:phosphoglycolate phosphatase-like HAD superfamily hydrolase